jgi:hypothetical protein
MPNKNIIACAPTNLAADAGAMPWAAVIGGLVEVGNGRWGKQK